MSSAEYEVAWDTSYETFLEVVNGLLSQGYTLQGGVSVSINIVGQKIFSQALVINQGLVRYENT